jgi:hypothetical protein
MYVLHDSQYASDISIVIMYTMGNTKYPSLKGTAQLFSDGILVSPHFKLNTGGPFLRLTTT